VLTYFIASPGPLPPSPSTFVEDDAWTLEGQPEPVWDRLALQGGRVAVVVHFTVGNALPPAVMAEWHAFAGRASDESSRTVLAAPASTFRVEVSPDALDARRVEAVAQLAAALTGAVEGVLVDVAAQRFWVAGSKFESAFDVRTYVSVHAELDEHGLLSMHTHGLARFGRPDLELARVPQLLLPFGTQVLNEVAQHLALGSTIRIGEAVRVDDYRFVAAASERHVEHCANETLALLDPPEAPDRDVAAPRNTLADFAEDVARDLAARGRDAEAIPWVDAALQVAPHRMSARDLRAQLG